MAVTDAYTDFINAVDAAYAALEDGRDPVEAARKALCATRELDWQEAAVARHACERAVADFTYDRKRRAA